MTIFQKRNKKDDCPENNLKRKSFWGAGGSSLEKLEDEVKEFSQQVEAKGKERKDEMKSYSRSNLEVYNS